MRTTHIARVDLNLIPQLEALVSADTFDPRRASQPVDLAGTDFAVQAYGAEICRQVIHQSPATTVRFHSWRFDTMAEQIRRGVADLGLYGGYAAPDLHTEELLVERFACVVADDHPLAGHPTVTLGEHFRFGHIVIDVEDGLQPDIDFPLQSLDLHRTPTVTVPYHGVVPQLLNSTRLIATVPATLAETWPGRYPVTVLPAPTEIATMPYRMIWHPAFTNDRRHQWLRAVIRSAVAATARRPD